MFCGFSQNDGTVDFYGRIRRYLSSDSKVLDLGAGRGAWFHDDQNVHRRAIRNIKDSVDSLVAADVDPVVVSHAACHQAVVLEPNGKLPFENSIFDCVIADYVLEHIADPATFACEIERVLKPGGLFAFRTPHRFSYVAIASTLIPDYLHSRITKLAQYDSQERDVFSKYYKLNTASSVAGAFCKFSNHSFIYRADPAYYFNSRLMFFILKIFHRTAPDWFVGNIFGFLIKQA